MVVRLVNRRSQQNHLIDQRREAPGQFARVNSSQAVSDDDQFALGFSADLGENPARPVNCAPWTIGVGEEPREVNLMAACAQPIGERIQGGVARQKARYQEDRSRAVSPLRDWPRPRTPRKLRHLPDHAEFLQQIQEVEARSTIAVAHAVSIATPRLSPPFPIVTQMDAILKRLSNGISSGFRIILVLWRTLFCAFERS